MCLISFDVMRTPFFYRSKMRQRQARISGLLILSFVLQLFLSIGVQAATLPQEGSLEQALQNSICHVPLNQSAIAGDEQAPQESPRKGTVKSVCILCAIHCHAAVGLLPIEIPAPSVAGKVLSVFSSKNNSPLHQAHLSQSRPRAPPVL